jgi:hypothetical protein
VAPLMLFMGLAFCLPPRSLRLHWSPTSSGAFGLQIRYSQYSAKCSLPVHSLLKDSTVEPERVYGSGDHGLALARPTFGPSRSPITFARQRFRICTRCSLASLRNSPYRPRAGSGVFHH